jgi:hypothetical protein
LPVVVLLERGNAIDRVFRLFHADFGASLGRIATMFGLQLAISIVGSQISSLIATPISSSGSATTAVVIVSQAISGVFSLASTVVFAPMLLTAYADMRARREPFSTAYLVTTP